MATARRLLLPHLSLSPHLATARRLLLPHIARRSLSFKIYTKTGDKGSSSLFNGERRRKDDLIFTALGDSDELNAALGVARAHCEVEGDGGNARALLVVPHLSAVQSRVLDLGSAIATPRTQSSEARLERTAFDDDGGSTLELEQWIDSMDTELPQLRNFILPGGGVPAASLHVARAICRRAERAVVPLVLGGDCDAAAQVYLNRLSDYLFTAARYVATHEVVYKKATE